MPTFTRWPRVVLPRCWTIFQSPGGLAEHPMFFLISGERFCIYKWSNLIHPTLEVAQEHPKRVFTNDGYLSFMLPLHTCTSPLQNMPSVSTPWLLPSMWGGCYFYYYSHFKVEETDMMRMVLQLGSGAGTRAPSWSIVPFCSQATLVLFSFLIFLHDTIS